jgi:hypothetical protein
MSDQEGLSKGDAANLSWRKLQPITDETSGTDQSAEQIEFTLRTTGDRIRIKQDPLLAARLGQRSLTGEAGSPTEQDSATGACLWETGVVVAQFLEEECDDDDEVFDSVLELGSGTGLLGCVLQRLRPSSSIICTDREEILPLLQENISENNKVAEGEKPSVLAMPYIWGDSVQPILDAFGRDYPTLVIAAGCIYDEESVPSLINTLRFLLLDSAAKGLVAIDENIYPTAFRLFSKRLPGAGLSLNEIDIEHLNAKESIKLYWVEPEDY